MTRSHSARFPLDGFPGTEFLPLRASDAGGRPLIAADQLLRQQLECLTGDTFISFAFAGNGISIWVADDRGMRFHAAPATATEMMVNSRRLIALCAEPGSAVNEVLAVSRWLYQTLIAPIEALLDDTRTIHLHTAGDFPWIPFGLLRTERGEWFGDRYRLRIARNFPWHGEMAIRETLIERGLATDIRFLIVDAMPAPTEPGSRNRRDYGSPDCDGGPLHDEGEGYAVRLASLMPGGRVLQGQSANGEALLRQVPDATVLHLRCAAMEGPMGAALQIPGSLDQSAIRDADASSRHTEPSAGNGIFPMETPPDWLANCRLALLDVQWSVPPGQQSAVQGTATSVPAARKALVLAMHRLGVVHLVAPLWNSGPEPRACYFEAYYRALAAGEALEECESRAAKAVRKFRRWNHPHHWAPFQGSTLHHLQPDTVPQQGRTEP